MTLEQQMVQELNMIGAGILWSLGIAIVAGIAINVYAAWRR